MEKLKVREIMSTELVTVHPDDDLATVYDLMMENDIRHLPVVDSGNAMVGIVSHRDLVAAALFEEQLLPVTELYEFLRSVSVREIMVSGVETVEPDESLEEAGRVMLDSKFGCLPVEEGERLVGILTNSDFVRLVVQSQSRIRERQPAAISIR